MKCSFQIAATIVSIFLLASIAFAQAPFNHSNQNILLYSSGGGSTISVSAPDGLVDNYELLLPTTAPSLNQSLSITAISGDDYTLSWTNGSLTGAGAATEVAYWNGAGSLTGSSNFSWDDGNGRLGIGSNSPTAPLDVKASSAGMLDVAVLENDQPVGLNNGANLLFAANRSPGTMTNIASVGGIITDISNGAYKGALVLSTSNNTGPIERVRIDNIGNVGIGTNSPGGALDVGPDITAVAGSTIYVSILDPNLIGAIASPVSALYNRYALPEFNLTGGSATVGTIYNNYIGLTATAGTASNYYAQYIAAPTGAGTVTTRYALVTEPNSGNIGIGTITPSQALEIKDGALLLSNSGTASQLQLKGTGAGISTLQSGAQGTSNINYTLPTSIPSANQVLTATAVASPAVTLGWTTPASTDWTLTGNSGTTAGTNFIGTTDNTDFVLKTGATSTERMRVTNGNSVTVGVQGDGATPPPQSFSFGAAGYIAASASSDQPGCDLVLQSGPATGQNRANGFIRLQTPVAVASGTTLQNLADVVVIAPSGAWTAAQTGIAFSDAATSSSADIVKTGVSISSTGTWSSGTATNTGLAVTVSGAPNGQNYAATFTGGNVGIGTTVPNASAIIDLNSTTAGFLPPRMTASQRDGITSPAEGLIVYQTDGTKGYYEYNSTAWVPMYTASSTLQVTGKSAVQSVTSSTALVNDNDLKISAQANEKWLIEGMIYVLNTNATPDIKMAFTIPSGTMTIGYAANAGSGVLTTSGTASANIACAANVGNPVTFQGIVTIGGTGGDIQLQWAQNSSNASATNVEPDSYIKGTKLP